MCVAEGFELCLLVLFCFVCCFRQLIYVIILVSGSVGNWLKVLMMEMGLLLMNL